VDPTQSSNGPGDNTAAEDSQDDQSQERPNLSAYPPYYAALQEISKSYPLVTEALMRSDRHRPRRLQQFIDAVDLQAMERLLEFLMSASHLLAGDKQMNDLAFLPIRIGDDVRMSLEGLLSGYLQIASDAMRDAIETELLIRDFALNPAQISIWRNADEALLRRSFKPFDLRDRQAKALGINVRDLPDSTDYSAHRGLCETLLEEVKPDRGSK
jgi:hypothetical protein